MTEYIKKYKFNIFVLIFTSILILIFILSYQDIKASIDTFKSIHINGLFLIILIWLIYYFFDTLSVHILFKNQIGKHSIFRSFFIAVSMHFFNGITPFNTGGQPFIIYNLNKKGISPNKTMSVLLMNFILYQFIITIYSIIAFIIRGEYINHIIGNYMIYIIIGFTVNFLVLLLLMLLAFSKSFNYIFIDIIYKSIAKIKLFKFLNNKEQKLRDFVIKYQNNFTNLIKNPKILLLGIIFNIMKMTFYYGIIVAIYISMNYTITFEVIITLIMISSFVWTTTAFIPTPGASVGSELFFILLFSSLFSNVLGALILWRFFTYYLNLFVGYLSAIKLERA